MKEYSVRSELMGELEVWFQANVKYIFWRLSVSLSYDIASGKYDFIMM